MVIRFCFLPAIADLRLQLKLSGSGTLSTLGCIRFSIRLPITSTGTIFSLSSRAFPIRQFATSARECLILASSCRKIESSVPLHAYRSYDDAALPRCPCPAIQAVYSESESVLSESSTSSLPPRAATDSLGDLDSVVRRAVWMDKLQCRRVVRPQPRLSMVRSSPPQEPGQDWHLPRQEQRQSGRSRRRRGPSENERGSEIVSSQRLQGPS
ncbi:hypothetical protein C8R46DRAFT_1140694 [Mycena filopes]|nr:hypothetical protein C8R46DRAFT_1140694 [Mycena filopes]